MPDYEIGYLKALGDMMSELQNAKNKLVFTARQLQTARMIEQRLFEQLEKTN
jgi:hypothetical protein